MISRKNKQRQIISPSQPTNDDILTPHQQQRQTQQRRSIQSLTNQFKLWSKHPHKSKNRNKLAQRAETILLQMEHLPHFNTTTTTNDNDEDDANMHNLSYIPDVQSYTAVINLYAQSGDAHNAERILQKLLNTCKKNKHCIRPDVVTFSAVLNAWAKSNQKNAPLRIENLLKQMQETNNIQPNEFSYNAIIEAYGRVGMAEKAEEWLRKLESESRKTKRIRPTLISYNTALFAWTKKNTAFGRKREAETACRRAHSLLTKMESSEDIQPDVKSYTAVIQTYKKHAQSPDLAAEVASEQVLKLLQTMEQRNIVPDVMCYNSILNVLVKTNQWDKMEHLLREMELKNVVQPDVYIYTTVMNAYSKNGDAVKAKRLLTKMKSNNVKPNEWTYIAAIRAYANSRETNKAEMAFRLLCQMIQDSNEENKDVKISNYCVTAILKACISSPKPTDDDEEDETSNVWDIALKTFRLFRDFGYTPNDVAYGMFFQLLSNVSVLKEEEERKQFLKQEFERCCFDGQVSSYVLKSLWDAVGTNEKLFTELVGVRKNDNDCEGDCTKKTGMMMIEVGELPIEWSCNVVMKKKRRMPRRGKKRIINGVGNQR